MTASNPPLTLQVASQLLIPSQMAWDLLTCPKQYQWNHALQQYQASLGFHTGSTLTLTLQSLAGPLVLFAQVQESTPCDRLVLESSFRYGFMKHTETWSFYLEDSQAYGVRLIMRYHLAGPFATALWRKKKNIINNILNVWLESIQHRAKRM